MPAFVSARACVSLFFFCFVFFFNIACLCARACAHACVRVWMRRRAAASPFCVCCACVEVTAGQHIVPQMFDIPRARRWARAGRMSTSSRLRRRNPPPQQHRRPREPINNGAGRVEAPSRPLEGGCREQGMKKRKKEATAKTGRCSTKPLDVQILCSHVNRGPLQTCLA